MHQKMTLEIRHQIKLDTDTGEYVLREMFGDQPPQEWRLSSLDEAKNLHERRQKLLKKMVASISDEARQAVDECRTIDNLKAGTA